jgi:hypothetical protein
MSLTLSNRAWRQLCSDDENKCRAAWSRVLASIANHTLHVDVCSISRQTLLHIATFMGMVDDVRRLLELHANPSIPESSGWLPMHFAAIAAKCVNNPTRVLDICKLLPPKDLAAKTNNGLTPLHLAIMHAAGLEVIAWMADQPESDLEAEFDGRRPLDLCRVFRYDEAAAVIADAIAARRRWTPPRAAWIAAVAILL